MGAYSPAPVVTDEISKKVMQTVIIPTIEGMAAEGNEYSGFLYAGLMISPNGDLKVLEYNCRFGDPETQPIMMRLQSDLVELCQAAIDHKLDSTTAQWDSRAAIGIVMAAGGYPADYDNGQVIEGLDSVDSDSSKVFHAGTREGTGDTEGQVVTSGGRVLCVVALGDSVTEAQKAVYKKVEKVHFKDAFYRTDIGYRAIAREA
jgi:phosphoribosylamine--glycine ligase